MGLISSLFGYSSPGYNWPLIILAASSGIATAYKAYKLYSASSPKAKMKAEEEAEELSKLKNLLAENSTLRKQMMDIMVTPE